LVNATTHVVVEESGGDFLHGAAGGGELGEDVDTR
jgi:hypothetical protein